MEYFSSSFMVPQLGCTWDTRCLVHDYVQTGWLRTSPGWWGCPDCVCACSHQGPVWTPTCLAVWVQTVKNLGANTPDHYYALVLEVKKGVRFHPVKLIRHSRAIGVSFCASNSAADEVTHVRVRSHSPGLYLPCVCLLIRPKPVQDSIQILPNSERVFPFGPGPESTDVQGHPLWTPCEPQRIRRQSLSPRDRIICWNCGPSATSGWGAHMQKERCRGAAGTTTAYTGLCHEGWPQISRAVIQQPLTRKGSQRCWWSWTSTCRI